MEYSVSIRHFYKGQSILVTGATGFLGKVVVEKLLRSCPEVEGVYLLIKPKLNCSDIRARLAHLLASPIYDHLKCKNPKILEKVVPICGDIALPFLGLNENERSLLTTTISVVIHCAGSVKFDDPLPKSLNLNVNGLRRIITLCKGMTNLKALVHISSAYANCDHTIVEEKVYPPPAGAAQIMHFLSEKTYIDFGDAMMETAMMYRPNSYTYSKALAEHVLATEGIGLPVCIVRPSLVTAAIRDPVAGWIDSLNGVTSLTIGFGLGVLRVLMCDTSKHINIIPVDMVANLILCAAWETASNRKHLPLLNHSIKVYNCCSHKCNSMEMKTLLQYFKNGLRDSSPFSRTVWYPSLICIKNKLCYNFLNLLTHFTPAVIWDNVTRSTRALTLYEQLRKLSSAAEYFTMNEWEFMTDNVRALHKSLNDEDRKCFPFKTDDINWKNYITAYCLGIRRHVMYEEDITLAKAKDRIYRLYRCHLVLNAGVMLIVLGFVLLALFLVLNIL